jgi:hypothetical protein
MNGDNADFWKDNTSVYFTSFWGWSPATWATVGWTGGRGSTRRSNLLRELTDPFIAVCYVTSNKGYIDPGLKGKIAGFYLVSHEVGDRDAYTHPFHHTVEIEKWRHSLKALRAFTYLPEYRLSVIDFDPSILTRARSVAAMGEVIVDPAQIERLRNTPWTEVEVFEPKDTGTEGMPTSGDRHGMVRAGTASAEGYVVANGSLYLPRELYVLYLDGNTDAFLGKSAGGRMIVKIGLAASPELRRQSFQKAMPEGAYWWRIERTTVGEGFDRYPNYASAEKGEYAMKRHLAKHAVWLGGEFYLTTRDVLDVAWQQGCSAAQNALQ